LHYAGREWAYQYRHFHDLCSESELQIQANGIAQQYAKLTKQWDIERNSEWSCRTYFATKMILNATVLVNSREFSEEIGMRTAIPYFEYYAALSLLRGLVYTLPSQSWDEGHLIEISHTKAINLAIDWLAKFNKTKASQLKATILQLKAQRELIAYRAPASGDTYLGKDYDLVELLIILAEAAEFNSEILQASIDKNADPSTFEVLDDYIHSIATVSIEGYKFSDSEDYHRLGYVKRKTKRPYHLALFMTPGQSEDFIGSWDGNEDKGEQFSNGSPSNWQAIFDVP
jgi:hypothetical protein